MKDSYIKTQNGAILENRLSGTEKTTENSWNSIKNIVMHIQEKNIGLAKYKANQEWMIHEILELIFIITLSSFNVLFSQLLWLELCKS